MENKDIHTIEPEETALLHYLEGRASEEEKNAVDIRLNTEGAGGKGLLQMAYLYYIGCLRERVASRDPLTAYKKVNRRLQKRIFLSRLKDFSVAAACILGVIGLCTGILYLRSDAGRDSSQWITLQANAGIRTHFALPDGTIVYLNSGSTLSYLFPYEPSQRDVCLSGEAYFKVSPDKERPFMVSVSEGSYRVKVLGTEFNMQAYKNEKMVSTTLVKGSVQVEIKDKNGRIYKHRLKPSQKAEYDRRKGEIEIKNVNTVFDTAWTEGKLMFKNTPLTEVLRKLSYYYDTEFTVLDPQIETYRFTGVLDNRQLPQTLEYLKISSEIDYRIENVKTDDSLATRRTQVVLWKRK